MKNSIAYIAFLVFTQTSCATTETVGMPCADSTTQSRRSQELQSLRDADQAERSWQTGPSGGVMPTRTILEKMSRNDLSRRMRVGAIFGEGCLKSAADFEAAFLIYQHGNTPGQYFQAFLWSKESLALGNLNVKSEVPMAIDRYLVSIGKMQLFGTQATQTTLGGCWCIQPIESSFPTALRDEYRGGPNAAYTGLAYLKVLNKDKSCPESYCATNLRPSPQGTVPGFW